MDARLRASERGGRPVEILRARRRAGRPEPDAWADLVTPDLEPAEAFALATELPGIRPDEERLLHEASGLRLRLIPGGRLGEVVFRPFLLAETPCTQAAWDRLDEPDTRSFSGPELPIDGVGWEAAVRWCARMGLRLPSEAEWEYAGRAGASTTFWFGDATDDLWDHAWYFENSNGLQPVATKPANSWGLFDVHGNVDEWCADATNDSQAAPPVDGSARVEEGAFYRIFRGGAYWTESTECGFSWREFGTLERDAAGIGFRPALSLGPGVSRSSG